MKYLVLALSLLAAGCGGGGQSAFVSTPITLPTAQPTPVALVSAAPTAAPSQSPTQAAPTATAVPASLKRLGGAPLTATASQLSRIRTQSVTPTGAFDY